MRTGRTGKALLGLILLRPILFGPATLGAGDTRVTVVVTPNPVVETESTQLRIEVSQPDGPVFQPTFDASGFTVMGSSSASSGGVQIINGRQTVTRNLQFSYVLMPKQAGTATIQNIRVKVGNDVLSSEDVRVKVLPDDGTSRPAPRAAPQAPLIPPSLLSPLFDDEDDLMAPNPAAPPPRAGGNGGAKAANPLPRFNSDFSVVAFVNKQKVYVGEPIVAEYYVYDFGGIRSCCEIQKWPTFNGFVKEDLEITSRFEFEDTYVSNQLMRRAFIGRFALYALKPGKYTLDKMQVRAKYLGEDTMGGNIFQVFDLRTGMHASQEVPLEILPLPEAGRPANFGGAVGQFTMKLNADKTTLPQNTPLNLSLTFQGTGNFQAIDSVKLPLPPDFELYESSTKSRDSAPIGAKRGLESQKSFQIVAIPRKAGKFEIPAYHWSYFDPKKQAYETLSTEPLTIDVTENAGGPANVNSYVSPGSAGTQAAAPANPDNDLRYLKEITIGARRHGGKALAGIAAALALLNLGLLVRLARAKLGLIGRLYRNIDPFSPARSELAGAKRAPGSKWQGAVEDALYAVQNVLLGINTRGLTKYELEEAWRGHGYTDQLYQRLQKVFQELDRSRFSSTKEASGGAASLREKTQAEAESILREAARQYKGK